MSAEVGAPVTPPAGAPPSPSPAPPSLSPAPPSPATTLPPEQPAPAAPLPPEQRPFLAGVAPSGGWRPVTDSESAAAAASVDRFLETTSLTEPESAPNGRLADDRARLRSYFAESGAAGPCPPTGVPAALPTRSEKETDV